MTLNEQIQLKMQVWNRVNAEVLQNMRMLDFWLMFILALLVWLIVQSRVEGLS